MPFEGCLSRNQTRVILGFAINAEVFVAADALDVPSVLGADSLPLLVFAAVARVTND
jgi:hypothetical protein